MKPVPSQVGPVHFETFGKLISVRCPREYAGMTRQHGGEWDPGARRWLIERHRVGPVLGRMAFGADRIRKLAASPALSRMNAKQAAAALRKMRLRKSGVTA